MSTLSPHRIKSILEAAIFIADEPVSVARLFELFQGFPEEEKEGMTEKVIRDMLERIQQDYRNRGIELVEVASGYRFQVTADTSPALGHWLQERPGRYSRAFLETLALIAYRQPITRAEIEQVRGVVVNTHIIKTLLSREWIKVVGHRDVPGKPALYATTKQFLDYFGLKSLAELPALMASQEDEGVEQLMLELEQKGD